MNGEKISDLVIGALPEDGEYTPDISPIAFDQIEANGKYSASWTGNKGNNSWKHYGMIELIGSIVRGNNWS